MIFTIVYCDNVLYVLCQDKGGGGKGIGIHLLNKESRRRAISLGERSSSSLMAARGGAPTRNKEREREREGDEQTTGVDSRRAHSKQSRS